MQTLFAILLVGIFLLGLAMIGVLFIWSWVLRKEIERITK